MKEMRPETGLLIALDSLRQAARAPRQRTFFVFMCDGTRAHICASDGAEALAIVKRINSNAEVRHVAPGESF